MRRTLAFVVVAAVVLLSGRTSASVLVPADLKELSQAAMAIAHGRVKAVESRWADDGRRRIETFVAIEVSQYLKGDLGSVVVVRLPGGVIGRYRSVMVGAPTFRPGEEVVVFLGARGPTFPFLLGLSQGVYRVGRDRAGVPVVAPPPVTVRASGSGPVERGRLKLRPWPLERFVREVRGLAAATPERGDDSDRLPRRDSAVGRGAQR